LLIACTPAAQPKTIRGVLIDVQSPSIQRVERFVVRTDDGRELDFVAASDFNAGESHAMSPGHMRQHMALADPVTVTYREEGGQLVALGLTD